MNKFTFIGDSKTKEFFFKFPFFTKQDIFVKINSTTTTDFKLFSTTSGMNADTPFTGGKIEFKKAPKSGDIITVYRKLELNRHVDYQPTAPLNPTTINQDMNFMLEILKDMHNELTDFSSKYSEITNTDSTEQLITKINTVISEIDKLGDISNIYPNLDTLSTAITTATNNIQALDNFKNGINDYVIEFQHPTPENGYRWYRKYNSGWVEQGGQELLTIQADTDTQWIAQLPIRMRDSEYSVNVTTRAGYSTVRTYGMEQRHPTFMLGFVRSPHDQTLHIIWQVSGIPA